MPSAEVMRNYARPVVRSELVRDLRALGVQPGGVLMVHTRPERIRTWPGARISGSHFRRMAAIGAAAAWLTEDQPWNHGFGPGSPLAKLVEADGQVLLLGAPLDRLTILHHAESLVDSPRKRMA